MDKGTQERSKGWDEAARKNAMYYIGDRGSQTVNYFFDKSGEKAEEFTREFFKFMNFDPAGKRMLDIGCGIGEMTRTFSDMFGEAYGVDFSNEMIKRAKELNKDKSNLCFMKNNGVDLSIYENGFFDFCFSFIVLQHIPNVKIIVNYIREIDRVLKPGGLFKFQVDGRCWIKAWGVLPIHRSLSNLLCIYGLEKLYLRFTNRDPVAGKIFTYYHMSRSQLDKILKDTNFQELTITGENTSDMWVSGRKKC